MTKTNCLTEVFFDRALATATQLDATLERTGHIVGSLHGRESRRFDLIHYLTIGM